MKTLRILLAAATITVAAACTPPNSTAHPPSATPPPATTTTTTTVHGTPPTEARLIAAAHEAQTIRFYNALEHQAAERAAAEQAEAEAAEAARRAAATTTTTAPAPPTTTPPVEAQQGTGRCGGDLPPCYVMMRESGGNIRAKNPRSTASGKWQFLDSTWRALAASSGYARAMDAPEHVQDAAARELWAGGAGCSHWLACR